MFLFKIAIGNPDKSPPPISPEQRKFALSNDASQYNTLVNDKEVIDLIGKIMGKMEELNQATANAPKGPMPHPGEGRKWSKEQLEGAEKFEKGMKEFRSDREKIIKEIQELKDKLFKLLQEKYKGLDHSESQKAFNQFLDKALNGDLRDLNADGKKDAKDFIYAYIYRRDALFQLDKSEEAVRTMRPAGSTGF